VTCQSCGHENPAGARFCNDCGAPLTAPAITPEPRSYTPRHLAEKILASRSALRGERKLVTVLFADVVRSMELAERVVHAHGRGAALRSRPRQCQRSRSG
jgi:zinc-ribbon domain